MPFGQSGGVGVTVATGEIDDDAVTYAKTQDVSATDRLLGRSTAGAGDVEEIACAASGRSIVGLTLAQGDVIYGSAVATATVLAKNASATRYLSNTGASNNPAWAQVVLTDGVSGVLPVANGGTNNAFFTVAGPATSAKTYTFPNANSTVLTSDAAVTVAQGGTGAATFTAYAVLCAGTVATGAFQPIAGVGTAGQALTSNGAGALPTFQAVTAGPLTVYKTADQEVTSTTLTNDNALTLTLAASTNYLVKAVLFTLNDGASEGFKVAVTGTVGVTSMKMHVTIYNDQTPGIATVGRITAIDTAVGATSLTSTNCVVIEGNIQASTGGTFLLSWAQNATGLSSGVHVQPDSSLQAQKVA